MIIGKVVGNIWATKKVYNLENKKLMLVQPIDPLSLKKKGMPIMAVDYNMNAGKGDIVLINDEGNSARLVLEDKNAPIRTVILGVVDEITVKNITHKFH